MEIKAIDSHSHIGYENDEEIVGKNIMMPYLPTFSEYLQLAKKNSVEKVLFAPCTSPMIIDKIRHFTKVYYLWEYVNGKYRYFSEVVDNGKIIKGEMSKNPYKEVNVKIFKYLKKLKGEISTEFISDVPLVIHTDFMKNPKAPIDYLYSENNPINWLKLLVKNDIKGYLVHGCRLSIECSRIMKDNNGQFLTGISPDILLANEPERLMIKTDNYLETLFNMFDIEMLAFDLDYNWNYTDRITYTYDDEQLNRLNKLKLSKNNKEKILKKNSERFFNL